MFSMMVNGFLLRTRVGAHEIEEHLKKHSFDPELGQAFFYLQRNMALMIEQFAEEVNLIFKKRDI